MPRLFMLLLSISVASLAGACVIAALAMGYYTWQAIVLSAALGAVAGVPVAWLVARRIQATDPRDSLD